MKRRKFLAAAPLAPLAMTTDTSPTAEERQLIEVRIYHLKWGSNSALLKAYLEGILAPKMVENGVAHFQLFEETADPSPGKIYALIAYPDATTYVAAQNLTTDPTLDQELYTRYESWLHLAFTGMPELFAPRREDAGLYELRIYEGRNEDAVARKINMFNDEEIPLFHEVGLHPVFFGDMIAGPYRPTLTYLLYFKDREERDANWKTFLNHPDWKAMLANEKYANTVSNIRRVFLRPLAS